jgi:hypothetical protein
MLDFSLIDLIIVSSVFVMTHGTTCLNFSSEYHIERYIVCMLTEINQLEPMNFMLNNFVIFIYYAITSKNHILTVFGKAKNK